MEELRITYVFKNTVNFTSELSACNTESATYRMEW